MHKNILYKQNDSHAMMGFVFCIEKEIAPTVLGINFQRILIIGVFLKPINPIVVFLDKGLFLV